MLALWNITCTEQCQALNVWLLKEPHFLAAVLIKGEGALQMQIPTLPLQSLGTYSASRGVWRAIQLGVGAFLE